MPISPKNQWWSWCLRGYGGVTVILNQLLDDCYPVTQYAKDEVDDQIKKLRKIRERMEESPHQAK